MTVEIESESVTLRSNNCIWCETPWKYIVKIDGKFDGGEFQLCQEHYDVAKEKVRDLVLVRKR